MRRCPKYIFQNAAEILPYTVGSSDVVMFDSAEPGDDPDKKVLFAHLRRGTNRILTQTYEPDEETSLVLHRFDWIGP